MIKQEELPTCSSLSLKMDVANNLNCITALVYTTSMKSKGARAKLKSTALLYHYNFVFQVYITYMIYSHATTERAESINCIVSKKFIHTILRVLLKLLNCKDLLLIWQKSQ